MGNPASAKPKTSDTDRRRHCKHALQSRHMGWHYVLRMGLCAVSADRKTVPFRPVETISNGVTGKAGVPGL